MFTPGSRTAREWNLRTTDYGLRARGLRAADRDARREHQGAAEDDLQGRPPEGGVHVTVLDPGDGPELDKDDDHGDRRGGAEARDQIGERMAEAANGGHQARGEAAFEGGAAAEMVPSSEAASVKPIEMPAPTEAASPTRKVCQVRRSRRRGKDRRQGRDRAVHQPGQARLHPGQDELPVRFGTLGGGRLRREMFAKETLAGRLVSRFGGRQAAEQLPRAGVGRALGGRR